MANKQPNVKENIGDMIKARRFGMCMSQTELARMAGIDRVTLWRIEEGRMQPSWVSVCALLGALGYEVHLRKGK